MSISNSVNSPLVKDSDMYKEVDWFMGEKGELEEILAGKELLGVGTLPDRARDLCPD